nr:DegT/DnrJ/EryC1/StrS family aminotransferase [uncultured Pseudodesulfovibrio sp.]
MKIPLVDLTAQRRPIQSELDQAIQSVIRDNSFIQGSYAKAFEREFATFCQADFCVGVGNGTDALFLALRALGVGAGDEVLVPAMTFVATAEAVNMVGATPVFVDVEQGFCTMNTDELQHKVTSRTKAVIPVHLYGHPVDMTAIEVFAHEHGLFVVQDAAQSHGATVDGKPLAAFGDCCCYSFYPGKNLGAYGDAGGVVTHNAELAERIRKFANHGRTEKYGHDFPGVNSRLDGIQAAVLSVKLQYLDRWTEARRQVARWYDEGLSGAAGIVSPICRAGAGHVYHLYVIQCQDRDRLRKHLAEHGIASGIHYPTALPFLFAYAEFGHMPNDFPVAHALQDRVLSLPMYPELEEGQVARICDVISDWEKQQ